MNIKELLEYIKKAFVIILCIVVFMFVNTVLINLMFSISFWFLAPITLLWTFVLGTLLYAQDKNYLW